RGPEELGITEGEDASVGRNEVVASARRRGRHANDRPVERDGAGRTLEGRITEGEDAAVGRHHPVAHAARRRSHADDRRVEPKRLVVSAPPTMGWFSLMLPVEPKNGAQKLKTPPSLAMRS